MILEIHPIKQGRVTDSILSPYLGTWRFKTRAKQEKNFEINNKKHL